MGDFVFVSIISRYSVANPDHVARCRLFGSIASGAYDFGEVKWVAK